VDPEQDVVITSSGLDLDIAVTGAMDDDDALMWVQPDRDGDGVYENLFDDGRNFVPANSALMDLTLTTDCIAPGFLEMPCVSPPSDPTNRKGRALPARAGRRQVLADRWATDGRLRREGQEQGALDRNVGVPPGPSTGGSHHGTA